MDLRLVAVQIVRKALTAVGRGGSLPGRLALKMDSHFIEKFHMPKHVILVTGTNGKTTTSNLIAKSIMQAGLKVINNSRGDNLNVGIATLLAGNSDANFNVQADVAVIEVDELTLYRQFKALRPTALVVNNFFRDQLDRAGEMETIIRKIEEVTENFEGDLIMNGDDPNVVRIAQNAKKAKVHYFSVGQNEVSQKTTNEASEGKFCPNCGARLVYDYYQTFTVDGIKYHSFMNTIYAIYNCAVVLTVMRLLGLDLQAANTVFKTFSMKEGRNEVFALSKPSVLNLIKNPTGANEVMKYIVNQEGNKNIAIFLNDNDQDGRDISWIWDAHFERLNKENIHTIVCSGTRAYDMALRLKYEGLEDHIQVIENFEEAIKYLDKADRDSYILSTYTALHVVRSILKKEAR